MDEVNRAIESVGRVESVTNEICIVKGLVGVALNNVVEFSSGGRGIVLGFDNEGAQIIILQNYAALKRGDLVRIVDDSVQIPVSESLLGRIIDPLGRPLDGLGEIIAKETRNIEMPAKPIYQRALVKEPFHSGYLVIDSQIPIGLGQRELLLGEKKVSHDDVAVDIVCNQTKNNTGVLSVYVAIDAESSATKRRMERLQKEGALKNTVVIIGRTSESASLNYIAPMVGMTIAEWFAAKNQNVLIVFDNLTRHAKVYRQLSLLLNRPASREAYPGDIFYLHARLLERCGAFNEQAGNGTITALPVVEIQSEEATDYITTNLMSITDGHILFRINLANKGIQPPVDSGFSVSRIGGRAQDKVMRQISVELKKIIIAYADIERFMAFGSDIHGEMLEVVNLGKWAQSIFYQTHEDCYSPPQEVLLSHFVVSKAAIRWPAEQMEAVKDALIEFSKKGGYDKMASAAYYSTSLDLARPILDEIINSFAHDPATPKPEEYHAPITAETDTITGLLRGDNPGVTKNAKD